MGQAGQNRQARARGGIRHGLHRGHRRGHVLAANHISHRHGQLTKPMKIVQPLQCAGATGKTDFVNLLIREKQANVNVKDKFGRTPIFLASRNGFLDCVQALLQNGADKDIEDRKGKKCLHYASEMGEWNIVKALGGKVPAVRIAGLGISKQDHAKAKGRKASMGDLIAIANRRRGTSIKKLVP